MLLELLVCQGKPRGGFSSRNLDPPRRYDSDQGFPIFNSGQPDGADHGGIGKLGVRRSFRDPDRNTLSSPT